MGVVIESSVWEPNPALYIFIFISCLASILLFPYASKLSSTTKNAAILLDHAVSSSFLRFQRNFLFLYSLASAMEGLWSVFGELELAHHGVSREQMVLSLCLGSAAALLAGPFLGVLSDLIGPEKFCMIFCILHLFVGIWKRIVAHPSVLVASICLSLASSVFSFSFETWMVVQHEKEGHRQDSMGDTFWLMTFFESASYIGSQMLANWLVGDNMEKNLVFPSTAAIFLAARTIICVTGGLRRTSQTPLLKEYRVAFHACIFGVGRIGCIMEYNNKRIWLLAWAQACLHFSVTMFWVLWAPTLVADGREVHMGLIYPCLLGARMLGSTLFPWLISGPSSLRTEDCLVYLFLLMGCVLSVIAYDYQEIGVLVALFCLFHACVGLILPSLARLRTMYVPNELRGGMMGLSLAPANAAILLFVIQGGYYRNIGNAAIMAVAALGLLTAAGSMHVLKQLGKQPYQKVGTNWDSYP